MARYHFNVLSDRSYTDTEGIEVHDIQQAKVEAMRVVGGLLSDEAGSFWNTQQLELTVMDPFGRTLIRVSVSALLTPWAIRPSLMR